MATTLNWREYLSYTAPDGSIYQLIIPTKVGRWVISQEGWGTPPIEYITQRGPLQHGETVLDYFLRPRTIQLLIRQDYCSRDAYWPGRAALLDAIRPNRQLIPNGHRPGVLTFTLPSGDQRCLDVYITEGPRFEPSQAGQWQEWSFQEVLRFTAYNPVIYDPVAQEYDFSCGAGGIPGVWPFPYTFGSECHGDLIFPITYPIIFGALAVSAPIVYTGTWIEYPTIVITGPARSVSINNLTTDESIQISGTIPAGMTLTIDLSYGNKTVTRSDGLNMIGTVTPESDLATWHLAPDPEAPGGVNDIHVDILGNGSASGAVIQWRSRYFGM